MIDRRPVENRVRDVAGLRTRRFGVMDHRLEHLRRRDHGLPALERFGDDPLLHERHELRADLDAEVAAGDHDRVSLRENVVERVDRLRLLDLGDHVSGRSLLLDQRLQVADVGGRSHERERDEVAPELEGELEVFEILPRQRRDRDRDTGKVHALVGRHGPAHDDSAPETAGLHGVDAEPDHPVVDQHFVPRTQDLADGGRGNRQLAVPGAVSARHHRHLRPLNEVQRLVERADAELRSLEVTDQRERPADLLLDVADELGPGRMVLMSSV